MKRLGDIGGIDAVERLRQQIEREARLFPGETPPSDAQIAMVLHALADHTSIKHALIFERESTVSSPWPEATSVGRWLHVYGDRFDDERDRELAGQPGGSVTPERGEEVRTDG